MIVAIMQPYFFPYIGYFQLIKAADIFIFHDDVQYIKGGWVNRNRILGNAAPFWITMPVLRAAHDRKINERAYELTRGNVARILRRIEASYKRAPRFIEIFPVLQEIMYFGNSNVASFNCNLIRRIAVFLGIGAKLLRSSEIIKENQLKEEARVIDLCLRVGATEYLNPLGGAALYQPQSFAAAGTELRFLESKMVPYPQFGSTPVPSLSIIDVLMFNNNHRIATMLKEYRLIR